MTPTFRRRTSHSFASSVVAVAIIFVSLGPVALTDSSAAAPQQDSITEASQDSLAIERLSDLGQLWGMLKVLHPWLALGEVDWDGAVVDAIRATRAAETNEQFAEAVAEMLGRIGDPATRIVSEDVRLSVGGGSRPLVDRIDDDIVVLNLTIPSLLTQESGNAAHPLDEIEWSKAAGFIIDLRSASPIRNSYLQRVFSMSGLDEHLHRLPLFGPGTRARMHSGFRNQTGRSSGGYFSAFCIQDGEEMGGDPEGLEAPMVVLVNRNSVLPPALVALQDAGWALVVSDGEFDDRATVDTFGLTLAGGIEVEIRLTDIVHGDGTIGLGANLEVSEASDENRNSADMDLVRTGEDSADPAFDAALELLRSAQWKVGSSPPFMEEAQRIASGRRTAGRGVSKDDAPYPEMVTPTLEYRLLAAYRIWTYFEYFFAYNHLMEREWSDILLEYIPRFESATDPLSYARAVSGMVTHSYDSHVRATGGAMEQLLPAGVPPVRLKMVEREPVVVDVFDRCELQVGDIVESVDKKTVAEIGEDMDRWLASSTPQRRDHSLCRVLLRGDPGTDAELSIRRSSERIDLRVAREESRRADERSEEMVRFVADGILYVDLDRLKRSDVNGMFETAKGAVAIIFDMRGYPNGTAWSIAPRLAKKGGVTAALFRRSLVLGSEGPFGGGFKQGFGQELPNSRGDRFTGPTVMLIDERTQSQAEHTGLFFEAANGTTFIGSPTSGTNGDVTHFQVPGGLVVRFTGHDVRHANGEQLQRRGIIPDIEIYPTIAGIREGRDEVLDAAVGYLESQPD